jgi:hypothetical protein
VSEVDPTVRADEPPSDGQNEQELRQVLNRRTGGVEAMREALWLARKTIGVGLPVAVIYASIGAGVGYGVLQVSLGALDAEPGALDLAVQLLGAAGAFATLYAVIQFTKRETASRASWAPALFAAPLLMSAGGLALLGSTQSSQMRPMAIQLLLMAWALLWSCFGGAGAVIAWLFAGRAAMDGRPTSAGEVAQQVRERLIEIAGPRGARIHAVTIGMQIVLPGVFYALQLAFTEMIAVLDPDRPALRRSGQLTFGMRGRLFRMMAVWWLIGTVLATGTILAIETTTPTVPFEVLDANRDRSVDLVEAEASSRVLSKFKQIDADRSGGLSAAEVGAWQADSTNDVTTFEGALNRFWEMSLDPASMTFLQMLVYELIWAVFSWILMLALLLLYVEREGQVSAKRALKKLKAAG